MPAVSDHNRRFRRLQISRNDFKRAIEFIAAAIGHDADSIEHEALLIAAVICYARPFSPNEKPPTKANAKLPKEFARFDDAEDRKLHMQVIKLRNKAVAHSEFRFHRVKVVGHTATSRQWRVSREGMDLFRFDRIAKQMETRCGFEVYAAVVHRD